MDEYAFPDWATCPEAAVLFKQTLDPVTGAQADINVERAVVELGVEIFNNFQIFNNFFFFLN